MISDALALEELPLVDIMHVVMTVAIVTSIKAAVDILPYKVLCPRIVAESAVGLHLTTLRV